MQKFKRALKLFGRSVKDFIFLVLFLIAWYGVILPERIKEELKDAERKKMS